MTREEFIGKLRSIFVGEENAIDEIISEYDSMINLNNQLVEECQRLDDEETRLNNIINSLEKELKKGISLGVCAFNKRSAKSLLSGAKYYQLFILDYLKELKENNNGKDRL